MRRSRAGRRGGKVLRRARNPKYASAKDELATQGSTSGCSRPRPGTSPPTGTRHARHGRRGGCPNAQAECNLGAESRRPSCRVPARRRPRLAPEQFGAVRPLCSREDGWTSRVSSMVDRSGGLDAAPVGCVWPAPDLDAARSSGSRDVGAAKGAPDQCRCALWPVPGGCRAGEGAGIPGSGAPGDGDGEVSVGVDHVKPLRSFEDASEATASGGDHLGLVTGAHIGFNAVLEHGADEGEPAWS
jgi:hypothetical protein